MPTNGLKDSTALASNDQIGPVSARGHYPESWLCVDCGVHTAPGCPTRAEVHAAFAASQNPELMFHDTTEVYTVRDAVWKAAGLKPFDGCLCIGCLEQRLGRKLKPKDFQRDHPLNWLPGTARLLQRRGA
jgi:hypothetical protein